MTWFGDYKKECEKNERLEEENKKLREELEELKKSLSEYTEQYEVPLGPVVFIDNVETAMNKMGLNESLNSLKKIVSNQKKLDELIHNEMLTYYCGDK